MNGSPGEPIRVLVVEDDPDWRRGLVDYLQREADIRVIAAAADRAAAEAAIAAGGYDVALLDIMLGDEPAGIDLAELVCRNPRACAVMLTSLEQQEVIADAYQAGALDYRVKSDFESLPDAVRSAYARRSALSPQVADALREELRRLKQLEHFYRRKELQDRITPSELQVLKMIDEGHTQPAIADKLVVSLRTIKVHVGNILKKLGGNSSREAASKARKMGLFDDREHQRPD